VIGALARYAMLGACAAAMAVATAGEGPVWRVEEQDAPPVVPRRPPQLNTMRDMGLALDICWVANLPPIEQARPGMTVTVMLTFTRSGALQGEPRFTYVTHEASAETRALYQRAAVAAINTCTPLPFTEALGNAVAGRPHIKRFMDQRNLKGT
jgi:hypothetical protein